MTNDKALRRSACITSLAILFSLTGPSAWGFEFKGFADVNYTRSSIDPALDPVGRNGSFTLGSLDLYLTQPLDDKLDVLGELVVESDDTGQLFVDLERIQISYHYSEWLKLHAGRFHNIMGYWNTAYHHAALFHASIDRPVFLAFEDDGGILPVHLVGLWVSGKIVTPPMAIDYGLMAGNGAHIDNDRNHYYSLDPGNIADRNKNKSVSANLTFQPLFASGLGLGVFGNFGQVQILDKMPVTPLLMGQVDQTILGADLFYDGAGNGLEFLSEYYRISDKDTLNDTGRFTGTAYYAQTAYKLTEHYGPYIRYEQVRTETGDPYFAALDTSDSNRWVYGLRYSINPASALKAEVRIVDQVGLDRYAVYAAQWAVGF